MKGKEKHRTKVLTWNTHMNRALTREMWVWIIANVGLPHVILLQEVHDWGHLSKVLGPKWWLVPITRQEKGTTVVAIRMTDRYGLPRRIVLRLPGKRHVRQIVAASVHDRRTDRRMLFGSLHVDPLGKGFLEANWLARRTHIAQVRGWAEFVTHWFGVNPREKVVILGGDGNEKLSQEAEVQMRNPRLGRRTLMAQFSDVGLRAAHQARKQYDIADLDDIWFEGDGTRCVERRQFGIPSNVPGATDLDHELVWAVMEVQHVSVL